MTGFVLSRLSRTAYLLQLQTVLLEVKEHANNFEDGDSCIDDREEEGFEVEAVVGNAVADGQTTYANQGQVAAGVVLYCIVWQGYPPNMISYEP
eukprot:3967339-Pleurochrysis_carterae.AAC.1